MEIKMKTNRRKFIQTMGAGAAGLGLAATVPSAAAQAKQVAKAGGTRRKMIIRADDVGFSKVCNIGTFETIEKGVVTSADVMLDSPGTEDALERLKAFPWISVGWHGHMWGAPVLDPKQVPSLVEKDGQFAGRFKLDLGQADGVVYEEAVRELRAQLDRCIRILGRVPDTGGGGSGNSPWGRAVKQVSDEYGLVYGFASRAASDKRVLDKIEAAQKAGEEWAKYLFSHPQHLATQGRREVGKQKNIHSGRQPGLYGPVYRPVSEVEKRNTILFCIIRKTAPAY